METEPALERLKKRIDGNREERARYQRMYDRLQDRTREITDAKQILRMSFWCEVCEADFNAKAYKIIRMHRGKLPIAWWVGFCPARHKCIRRVTDKVNDKYYLHSYIVKRDRARFSDDLLTPENHRFWLLYGHLHGMDAYKQIDTDGKPEHTY